VHGFVCPRDRQPLSLSDDGASLISDAGLVYPIRSEIPDFAGAVADGDLPTGNQDYYRARASEYDKGNDVMFAMLRSDEATAREGMIETLALKPGARVLEIGCGTCRDTLHLLKRGVTVYAGDLSYEMLLAGRQRLETASAPHGNVRLFRGNAMALPFPDSFFDAAFHFGGLNLFPDIAGALKEISRVVRPGGRVAAGDEGVGPWLADTDFARILKNSNPLFTHTAPIDRLPVNARDVACQWVLNGSFYLLSFTVGEGEPALDLDVEFPGWRGGSHRTRYYGKLEGVSPELRESVIARAAAEGLSIAAWLERTLRAATSKP
jgi:ubiquinone/menaquinone biosynthesis C-methylase UbiE